LFVGVSQISSFVVQIIATLFMISGMFSLFLELCPGDEERCIHVNLKVTETYRGHKRLQFMIGS